MVDGGEHTIQHNVTPPPAPTKQISVSWKPSWREVQPHPPFLSETKTKIPKIPETLTPKE